jgi:ribosome-interacting GTPase 1
VGPPNTGKSSLLASITHAEAKVADYPFTTVVPQPGMWVKDGIPIELIDTPPLTPEHVPSGLMGTIRSADIVCVVVEAGDQAFDQVESGLAILSARQVTLHSGPRNQLLLRVPHPQNRGFEGPGRGRDSRITQPANQPR